VGIQPLLPARFPIQPTLASIALAKEGQFSTCQVPAAKPLFDLAGLFLYQFTNIPIYPIYNLPFTNFPIQQIYRFNKSTYQSILSSSVALAQEEFQPFSIALKGASKVKRLVTLSPACPAGWCVSSWKSNMFRQAQHDHLV